jgi:hypothetical protein
VVGLVVRGYAEQLELLRELRHDAAVGRGWLGDDLGAA